MALSDEQKQAIDHAIDNAIGTITPRLPLEAYEGKGMAGIVSAISPDAANVLDEATLAADCGPSWSATPQGNFTRLMQDRSVHEIIKGLESKDPQGRKDLLAIADAEDKATGRGLGIKNSLDHFFEGYDKIKHGDATGRLETTAALNQFFFRYPCRIYATTRGFYARTTSPGSSSMRGGRPSHKFPSPVQISRHDASLLRKFGE